MCSERKSFWMGNILCNNKKGDYKIILTFLTKISGQHLNSREIME